MQVGADAIAKGVKKIAWFAEPEPLKSGWAIGQGYLKDGVEMASAQVGQGMAYFYAPEMTFRAQPDGTFKFIFNTFYGEEVEMGDGSWEKPHCILSAAEGPQNLAATPVT